MDFNDYYVATKQVELFHHKLAEYHDKTVEGSPYGDVYVLSKELAQIVNPWDYDVDTLHGAVTLIQEKTGVDFYE